MQSGSVALAGDGRTAIVSGSEDDSCRGTAWL